MTASTQTIQLDLNCENPATDRRLRTIWTLLFVNVLGLATELMLLPVPRAAGQVVTMGALVIALGLALRLNPMVEVRFNAYLTLLSLMSVVGWVSSAGLDAGLGSLARCVRLSMFVATLWLVSPWWRGDARFLGYQLRAIIAVLISVLLGAAITPGKVLSDRLTGVIWPIAATQVGQYAAVAIGLVVLLWLTGNLNGRRAVWIVGPSVAILLLSQTRTAMAGLLIGLGVASFTLIFSSARARRLISVLVLLATVIVLAVPDVLISWYQRDQTDAQLAGLTGRQKVWDAMLAVPRTPMENLFGIGLTNKSFNGLSIDNAWLATYQDLGQVGVALIAAILILLLASAMLRTHTPERRCAIFLIVYCAVASYTEVGLGDASPYLMSLAVAASLVAPKVDPGETQSKPPSSAPKFE